MTWSIVYFPKCVCLTALLLHDIRPGCIIWMEAPKSSLHTATRGRHQNGVCGGIPKGDAVYLHEVDECKFG